MLPQLRRHFKIYISSSFFSPFTRINCITFSLIWNTYKSQWSFMQSSTMNMNMSWGFIKMKAPKLSPINTWKGWQWLMGKAKLKKSHMADWPFSCRGHQGAKPPLLRRCQHPWSQKSLGMPCRRSGKPKGLNLILKNTIIVQALIDTCFIVASLSSK